MDRVEKAAKALDDAIDNALIAWGMGWDMDGVMACLKEAKDAAALATMGERGPVGPALAVTYRNYRGEVAVRSIIPKSVRFGSTEWHPEPQWLLLAFDTEKKADREFAMADMSAASPRPEAEIARLTEARRKDAEAFESLRNANTIVRDRAKAAEALVERYKIALADATRRPMGVTPDSAVGLVTAADMEAAEARRPKRAALSPAVEVDNEVEPRF